MKAKWPFRIISSYVMLTGFWAGGVLADAAGDAVGQQVAADLRARFYDTRMFCGRPSAPGFLCNGIIFRATIPSTAYVFWAPSPMSVANGGWSFSYFRDDAKFKKLVRMENNGNILYPPLLTPPNKMPAQVLCAFPDDAGSFTRPTQQGCGPSTKQTTDSRMCHEQGIVTAEQWIAKHFKENLNNINQCGFNVRDNANEKATQSFEAFIKAIGLDKDSFDQQNELRLAIWDESQPKNKPIQALFYTLDGLADAQFDQKDYLGKAGECLPIIRMTLPQTLAQDPSFVYAPSDQLCSPTAPAQYIQSAVWVQRLDPGTGKNEWSLSITPTAYGRLVQADRTDALFAELEKKFGNDPQWKNNDGGGMRRQLVCHLRIARDKTAWNIEPYRKEVSEAEAEAKDCNP